MYTQNNPKVFLDVSVGGVAAGRLVLELRADVVPYTVENFRVLCTGERGVSETGKNLHFKGSCFHRILPGCLCQGGDITRGDGTGGESYYGTRFADENFELKHDRPGVVSMANGGPGTNSSQFFITSRKAEWVDGQCVAFGYVTDGIDVLDKIDAAGSLCGKPVKPVVITDCGQLDPTQSS
mmetsp:Transcript_18349/g.49333  ORF Transcript_18349/g.49333 Transcript_18349/m.49333 type:complete len:181 (-) Transcript_18349:22-564(-)